MAKRQMTPAEAMKLLKPRDTVVILSPNGYGRNGIEYVERVGKVVIAPSHRQAHATLNLGGQFGTPGIADESNIVKISRPGLVIEVNRV